MSFLSPLFLVGALAAAVPIVLHLLKRAPEPRVRFSAVRLLRNAPIERTDRRRLNDLLLLALRVAALLLLAAAFARPFFAFGGETSTSGVTVVALDTSLSMSGPVRFERARTLARAAVDQAPSGALVSFVTFADRAHVEVEPTTDRALARSAIDTAAPGFEATSYRSALTTSAQVLGGRAGTIVLVTDLQEIGWDGGAGAALSDAAAIRLADVGALPANLAVTGLRVSGDRIVATVRNTGSQTREARVSLSLDGPPSVAVGVRGNAEEAKVAVGASQSVDVPFPIGQARSASVAVDDREGIEGDNVRYLVLDGGVRPVVLVLTQNGDPGQDAFYVEQALIAPRADGDVYVVEGVGGDKLASWSLARLEGYRAIVLSSTRGLERNGRELIAEYVKAGGGVLVAAGPGVDGDVLAEALGLGRFALEQVPVDRQATEKIRRLLPLDVRHPVFEAFGDGASSLGLVKFARVSAVQAAGCHDVARFTTGEPALIDCASGKGRVVMLASDINNRWNDFPLHASFVPFLHQVVRYLSEGRRRSEYLVADVPPDVPPRPGIATAAARGSGGARLVAVNVDPRESDPRRLTEEDFRAAVTKVKEGGRTARVESTRQAEGRQQLWRYLLVLMVTTLVLEGVVAARAA